MTLECSSISTAGYRSLHDDVQKILDKRTFNEEYKIEKLIHKTNSCEIWIVLRKDNNHKSVCKIYNVNNDKYQIHDEQCYDRNSIYHYFREYKIVQLLNLLMYHNIYYDELNQKMFYSY
eukprot:341764_1